MQDAQLHVGLMVTCLVDQFRPSVGFAAVKLLEAAGCRVSVPPAQTCCGQPAYNAGDRDAALALAKRTIGLFEEFDYVVAPSGSCGGMAVHHYPRLLAGEAPWAARAAALAAKTHELTQFLATVVQAVPAPPRQALRIAYHDSCSGLRELRVKAAPRTLLAGCAGVTDCAMNDAEACCGFGGFFAIEYGDISAAIADRKIDAAAEAGADILVAGDLGCLMHLAGRAKKRGVPLAFRHVAEVLAGDTSGPPIGEN